LLAGVLFWGRVFARRPAPHAPTHGWRLMMIWIAVLSQLLLGAYLTVKTTILYTAYLDPHRIGTMSPLIDEQTGGFLIWVPSSFLSLIGLIVVIDQWGRHETRMDVKRRRWSPSNSAILLYPETAAALRAMVRGKNRRLRIGLLGFAALVFGTVFVSAIGGHQLDRRDNIRQYLLSKS
ncbi:MAG: cytochrome c oxidase assembly protein, partial [Pseudomonadota bacterium]|nr:cytochrome c oxidase assembly protein [Pseudomonadota bacterium]